MFVNNRKVVIDMEDMREKIKNVVDLKRYLDAHSFDEYIIEVDQLLKLSFDTAVIQLAPNLMYLYDRNGNHLCLENIKNPVLFEENDFIIILGNENERIAKLSCCQCK